MIYPILTRILHSFSCSSLNTAFYIGKNEKGFKNILNSLRCNVVTSFYHYNDVTERRATDVRLSIYYLSHRPVRVYEIELSQSQSGVPETDWLHLYAETWMVAA